MLDHFTLPDFLNAQKPQRAGYGRTDKADFFSAGTLVTSPRGHGTQYGLPIPTIERADEAEAFVEARLAEGSDWIKIVYEPGAQTFTSVDRATLEALIAAAQARGVLAVVHVSRLEAARDAVQAGADGLVHLFGDAPIDDALIEEMAERDVFVVPTLEVAASVAGEDPGAAMLADARLAPYISALQRSSLTQTFDTPPAIRARFNTQRTRDNVAALHAAGVRILAGTDAPNPGTAYGVSLHGELSHLARAGLSAQEALAAATSVAAGAFGLDGRGVIAPGARADLVLVEGDPTRDIEAARAILRVFKNGYEVARVRQDQPAASAGTKPKLDGGYVSRFEQDIASAFGAPWVATTDAMAGGASTAALSRTTPGAAGSAGALRVEGAVSRAFAFPWAGAGVFFSEDFTTGYDLSDYGTLSFMARGAERDYSLFVFSRTSRQRPAMAAFRLTGEWSRVEIDLSSVAGAALDEVYGFALAAGLPEGDYWFEIDDVQFE
jgi:imidazolonepropionase-like amidohydrolase